MASRTATVDEENTDAPPTPTPKARRRSRGPNRSPQIEKYLNDKSVQWEFLENVSPGSFDLDKSLRNQARLNKLIPTQVDTYVDAMRRGDQFPPIIAWRKPDDGKLVTIDGNHRLESTRRTNGSLDVYVVNAEQQMITLMTFDANTRHGMPTSPQERVIHALWLMDTGASMSDAAALVGARLGELKKEWNRRQAERRAKDVGILMNQWDALHPSVRTRLLNLKVDEVFKAAAELAYKGNLTVQEVFDLVSQLNESSSMTRQMAYIEHMTTGIYQERIAAGAGIFGAKQGRSKQTPKTRANMAIGQILHLPDNFGGLVSYFNAQERETAAQKAREASKKLDDLASALESGDA